MKSSKYLILLGILPAMAPAQMKADRCFYLPMEVNNGKVTETVAGKSYEVNAANVVEPIAGAKGSAVRFDGYSSYVTADMALGEMTAFTFSLWCAMETWPIIEHDVQNETDMTCIAGNYDAASKRGCGFFINRVGKLSFKFYSGGWPGEVTASTPLPLYEWNNLVAVCDGSKVTLYNNGTALGSTNCKKVDFGGTFMVGKSAADRCMGPFNLYTVNGIIDEIEVYDEALPAATISGSTSVSAPQLCVAGEGKYDGDVMRPRFHGMPVRNWTNETHGLVHYDGRYHLFFQKNANGPYMSRLQWGHIVSDNLYDWTEEPIAIGSDKWYDIKGCWSGCVAVDDEVTGGKPNIIYTGVDYARAMIGQAAPADDGLLGWTKRVNPIIDGRPSGLSDDFRDPYFFRSGDKAYIIVGTSKDGRGACTLHEFNPKTKGWSNDGRIFFSATDVASQGSFWEMPNITDMGGTYLFTTTPQGLREGVQALYWTGSVQADGTFNPSSSPATIELPGFAKDGFGLLSPSIMQADGKTIVIGIVPDKLPSEDNFNLGWAHTYSLPREWSLDTDGQLIQKPYSGLEAMREGQAAAYVDKAVDGHEELGAMSDRQIEVIGEFTVADADFGFTFFKNGDKGARLSYSPSTRKLTLDIRSLDRLANDRRVFDGLYETYLPKSVEKGSVMKLHVFVDHSIMDIFVNDRWASSVRLFPTDAEADGVDVFSEGGSTAAKISAWTLNPSQSGISDIIIDNASGSGMVDVYDFSGMLLRKNVARAEATRGLLPGLYIVGGKKILVP